MACRQFHSVRNQKRGVEPHTELADQIGIVGGITAQCFQELTGARARNSADVLNDFIGGHANAVIRDRDGLFVFVDTDFQSEGLTVLHEAGVSQSRKPESIAGIRAV